MLMSRKGGTNELSTNGSQKGKFFAPPVDNQDMFPFQKLDVYKAAVNFLVLVHAWAGSFPKGHSALIDQLKRAALSIPLNIAEGNGQHTSADRCRFFDTARGSALECAACLDVLVAKKVTEKCVADDGKRFLLEIVSMLVGLIRSSSPSRDV